MKLTIFYHALVELGDPPAVLEPAVKIIREQMDMLKSCGLLDAASEFIVGINGGEASREIASLLIPSKATIVMHGLQCRNEVRSILMLEKWLKEHSEEAYVLYFHAKGCTHPEGDYVRTRWRGCMQKTVVNNWRQCVADLDGGYEAVGVHYMFPPATPAGQFIFAGNFWWSKASFLRTLPSIMARDRIKGSGVDSIDSRYESEVWIGNGTRPPRVKDYHWGWNPGKIGTCTP